MICFIHCHLSVQRAGKGFNVELNTCCLKGSSFSHEPAHYSAQYCDLLFNIMYCLSDGYNNCVLLTTWNGIPASLFIWKGLFLFFREGVDRKFDFFLSSMKVKPLISWKGFSAWSQKTNISPVQMIISHHCTHSGLYPLNYGMAPNHGKILSM